MLRIRRHISWVCLVACTISPAACVAQPVKQSTTRLYFAGQDLDSLRGYFAAEVLPNPSGTTAYVGFFNIDQPMNAFGGLGLDLDGEPVDAEGDWGAGSVNAAKSAAEFGVPNLAVGLHLGSDATGGQLDALASGKHDQKILRLGQLCGRVEGTVYLRIGFEFDGAWNAAYADPARFKRAWRRIAQVLREAGVDNVEFVWQACASPHDDAIDGRREHIADWYPGDDVVDWLAFSWFMHPDTKLGYAPGVATPRELANEVMALARKVGKPVMVAELAPQGFDLEAGTLGQIGQVWDGPEGADRQSLTDDEIWSRWFEPFFAFANDNTDVIRAICYINCDWDSQPMWGPPYESGYWGDSRLQTRPELAQRWTDAVVAWRQTPVTKP